MGIVKIKKAQALCHWRKLKRAGGQPDDANLFDEDALNASLQHLKLEDMDKDDDHTKVAPNKLDALNWISWERAMSNYLSQLPSHMVGVPLVDVIRKLVLPTYQFFDDNKRRLYSLSLTGPLYQKDNKKVFKS